MAAFRKYVVKLVRNGNSCTVSIPSSLLAEFGMRRGDHVYVTRVGRSLLVTPVEDVLEERAAQDMGAVAAALTDRAQL